MDPNNIRGFISRKTWQRQYLQELDVITSIRDKKFELVEVLFNQESARSGHTDNLSYLCKEEIISPHFNTLNAAIQEFDKSIQQTFESKERYIGHKGRLSNLSEAYIRSHIKTIIERAKGNKKNKGCE